MNFKNFKYYFRLYFKYQPRTREQLDILLDRDDVEYEHINVSHISDMSFLFCSDSSFTKDVDVVTHKLKPNQKGLINWNVSNVIDMRAMFCGASDFNQPIGKK